jgi:hypothetical protein
MIELSHSMGHMSLEMHAFGEWEQQLSAIFALLHALTGARGRVFG